LLKNASLVSNQYTKPFFAKLNHAKVNTVDEWRSVFALKIHPHVIVLLINTHTNFVMHHKTIIGLAWLFLKV